MIEGEDYAIDRAKERMHDLLKEKFFDLKSYIHREILFPVEHLQALRSMVSTILLLFSAWFNCSGSQAGCTWNQENISTKLKGQVCVRSLLV